MGVRNLSEWPELFTGEISLGNFTGKIVQELARKIVRELARKLSRYEKRCNPP